MSAPDSGHVFPRQITAPPPKAVRGQGCYLYDSTGKQYFDGSGGAAVSCLGHGDPDIIQHDILNVLGALRGYAEMLLDDRFTVNRDAMS